VEDVKGTKKLSFRDSDKEELYVSTFSNREVFTKRVL
jgi:hypothetical protein